MTTLLAASPRTSLGPRLAQEASGSTGERAAGKTGCFLFAPRGRQTRPIDRRPACPWAAAPGRSRIESCVLRVTVHRDPPARTLSGQRERWTARVDRKAEAAQPHGSQGGPPCPQASVSRHTSRMSCKQFHTGLPGPTRGVRIRFQSSVVSPSFQLTEPLAGNDKLTVPCSRSWELS